MASSDSIRQIQQDLKTTLENAGVPEPGREVLSLLTHVTGEPLTRLISGDVMIQAKQLTELNNLVRRRASGEPLQYLTGSCGFWRHLFLVAPGVLIPRPETEHIVEQFLAHTEPGFQGTIVDCGTGSGNIAISASLERRLCRVIGIDRSPEALRIAETNRKNLKAASVNWVLGDMLTGVAPGSVDVILSNPPYVHPSDRGSLQRELEHEPESALFSEPDGLTHIRRLMEGAAFCLKKRGLLIFEFGYNQGQAIRQLARESDRPARLTIQQDLRGVERIGILGFD